MSCYGSHLGFQSHTKRLKSPMQWLFMNSMGSIMFVISWGKAFTYFPIGSQAKTFSMMVAILECRSAQNHTLCKDSSQDHSHKFKFQTTG